MKPPVTELPSAEPPACSGNAPPGAAGTRRVSDLFDLGPLKTTAIGGIFFLLPLIVVGALVGQVVKIVWTVAVQVAGVLPAHSWTGYLLVVALSVGLLVLGCFLAGFLARRRLARRFNESLEKYVLMLVPRYAIIKEQLTGNIGGNQYRNTLIPVLVQFPGYQRVGFEVERGEGACAESERVGTERVGTERGESERAAAPVSAEAWVTVYLPGAPDPWTGVTVVVSHRRVRRLDSPFGDTVTSFEQVGRGTLRLLAAAGAVAAHRSDR